MNSFLRASVPLAIALTLAACGGGGDSDPVKPTEPEIPQPTKPTPLALELLAGVTTVDLQNCGENANQMDWNSVVPASSMRFTRLMRTTVYKDAVYFVETGEGCQIFDNNWLGGFQFDTSVRRLLELTNGSMRQIELGISAVNLGPPSSIVQYPSGYARSADRPMGFVLSYVIANSDKDYAFDAHLVSRYSERENRGWHAFAPGLFHRNAQLSDAFPYFHRIVAGRSGKLPALIDGQGLDAGFVAPHDLEVDAQGLFYLIDDGHIRTIDDAYNVKTLDSAALGITSKIKALDGDHQGRIHALTKQAQGQYTWHRLADGSSVNFTVPSPVEGDTLTAETFTIMDDEMLMSVRESTPYSPSRIFHVSATGEVTAMTGTQTAPTEQDFLENSTQYLLPAIQHLEYGVDGHLYLVLPQGVLIARNYKITAQ